MYYVFKPMFSLLVLVGLLFLLTGFLAYASPEVQRSSRWQDPYIEKSDQCVRESIILGVLAAGRMTYTETETITTLLSLAKLVDYVIPSWPYHDSILEYLMRRTPIPPISRITPQEAQRKLLTATDEEIRQIVYQYAVDHGLIGNLLDPQIYEKLQRWRIGV